ncbi:MAG: hypothetical protein R3B54_12790 [Bdellovibrionota bacterium]
MKIHDREGMTLLELLIAGVIVGVLFVAHQYYTSSKSTADTELHSGGIYASFVLTHKEVLKNWRHFGSRTPASAGPVRAAIATELGIKPEHVVLYVNTQTGSAIAAGGLVVGEKNIVLKPRAILTRGGSWQTIPQTRYVESETGPPTNFDNLTFVGVWNHAGADRVVVIRRDDTGGMFKHKLYPFTFKHHFSVDGEVWESDLALGKTLKGWNNLRGKVRTPEGASMELLARVYPVELESYGRTPPSSTLGNETITPFEPAH